MMTPYEKIARTLLALKLKETSDGDPNKQHLQALENEMLIHERDLENLKVDGCENDLKCK